MKKIIASLFLVFLCSNAFSYTETFNPYTGKLDKVGASASSDINIVCPAGQALISSGSGTWACGSAGGASIGGTVTSGTAGSVLLINPDATLSQDNQGLHYDDSHNRLSVFTTLGSEVLTNPNFTGSATGWTVPAGMAYATNAVSKTSNGTGALTQNVSLYTLREYLLTYVLTNVTVGSVTPTVGGFTGTAVSANGTYTERFVATSSSALTFTPTNTARFTIDTISLKPLTGSNTASNINTGGLSIEGSWSNGSPGTTRGFTYNNDGSYSWTDYRFAGVLRGAIGANSSGGIDMYASGSNYFAFYQGNSGLTSNSLFSYSYPTAFVHYGYGAFNSGVMAGATYANTSTLQTIGSTALQVKRITSSQSIDATATIWLSDATSASACTGTPSTSTCSSYTGSGQATCESHLPCVWNAGSSCSAYNGDQGSCQGTSGCTYETASCTGFGDQSTCESYSCSWSGTDCSGLDEGTCGSYSGQCTQSYGDCSPYSDGGGDGSACSGYNAGCSYDSGTGACTGTPYIGCSGTYYTCTGSYYTGSCTGTYGTACSGTVLCSSYGSSTPCAAEAGCSWSSVLNLTLPDGETCTHRNYWIYNDATGGADTIIYPYSGQTVNETTSYTLSAYRDWIHLAYYKQTKDCSVYNEGACTPSGCTKNYSNCSYNTMDNTCTGDAVCPAHDGNQSNCEAQQYYTGCSGTEIIRKNWYKVGS